MSAGFLVEAAGTSFAAERWFGSGAGLLGILAVGWFLDGAGEPGGLESAWGFNTPGWLRMFASAPAGPCLGMQPEKSVVA